jgi:hypothetical protein
MTDGPHQVARLRILNRLPAVTILQHVTPEQSLWGTSNRRVLRGQAAHFQVLGRLPRVYPRDLCGWTRLGTRFFRTDRANLYVNRRGTVVAIRGGKVYRLTHSPFAYQELGPIQGDCALHGGLCEDAEGCIYFGEYFGNPERQSVRIWRVPPDGRRMEIAHEFPAGSIRHVHGVFPDPYEENRFWVATGDYENECYLFATDPRFSRLERVGDGTQTWRAVTLYFTPTHVCWITDSHLEPNRACRLRRSDGSLELGQAVDCSAWHGMTTVEGDYIACTTVERGPGILSNDASVLVSRDAFHWQTVASFPKDAWRPFKAFKAGAISCPTGQNHSNGFYLSGQALKGFDGITLHVALDWQGAAATGAASLEPAAASPLR